MFNLIFINGFKENFQIMEELLSCAKKKSRVHSLCEGGGQKGSCFPRNISNFNKIKLLGNNSLQPPPPPTARIKLHTATGCLLWQIFSHFTEQTNGERIQGLLRNSKG